MPDRLNRGQHFTIIARGSDAKIVRTTINAMRDIVLDATNPRFPERREIDAIFAAAFPNGIPRDPLKVAAKIEKFVYDNVEYFSDPDDYEYLVYPQRIWEDRKGDCDDMTILFCTLARLAGVPTSIEAIKYNGHKRYSHVYPVVFGEVFDPTIAPGDIIPIQPGDRVMRATVPV